MMQSMTSALGECNECKSSLAQYQLHTALSELSWRLQSLPKHVELSQLHLARTPDIQPGVCVHQTELLSVLLRLAKQDNQEFSLTNTTPGLYV